MHIKNFLEKKTYAVKTDKFFHILNALKQKK